MTIRNRAVVIGTGMLALGTFLGILAQERPTFRIKVDMVVLSFTVTDSKGHYINGLKPTDFRVTEDTIAQKINTATMLNPTSDSRLRAKRRRFGGNDG